MRTISSNQRRNDNQEPENLKKEENINIILKRKTEYLPEESNRYDEPVRKKIKLIIEHILK